MKEEFAAAVAGYAAFKLATKLTLKTTKSPMLAFAAGTGASIAARQAVLKGFDNKKW